MNNLNTRKTSSMKARRIISNTFIYIILVIISIIWIFPFVYLLLQSFRGESTHVVGYMIPQKWTLDNYKALFDFSGQYPFMRWYLTTLVIALVSCIFQTIFVLMTSYCLSRMRFKARKGIMKLILIIGMFPGFLSMIAIYFVVKQLGLIGNDAPNFGGPLALILVYIAGSATQYYIVKGFFDTIPKSLDEAAMIDGANRNTIFWKIILPLSKPIVIYTILITFVAPWGDFMLSSYILGTKQSSWTVAVGLQNWLTGNNGQNISKFFTRFCSGAVFTSIPIMVLFFLLQRYYVEGITGGSVKG